MPWGSRAKEITSRFRWCKTKWFSLPLPSLYKVTPLSGCHMTHVIWLAKEDKWYLYLYNGIDLWKVRICRGHVALVIGMITQKIHQPETRGHGKDQDKYQLFLNFKSMLVGECHVIWKEKNLTSICNKKKKLNHCLTSQSCFIRLSDQNKTHDRCPCEIFQHPNIKRKIAGVKKIVMLNWIVFIKNLHMIFWPWLNLLQR